MDNIQNVSVVSPVAQAVNSLIDSRAALVGAAKKTGQVVKVYAMALCATFDLTDNQGQVTTKWFDLKGALKKGVKAEREAFCSGHDSRGVWQTYHRCLLAKGQGSIGLCHGGKPRQGVNRH